jgi:uncharacterized protein (TIGR00369 family)
MSKFEAPNPNFAQDLERLVEHMPIVKFLGLRFRSLEPGEVRIEMPYRDELAFVPGAFHAGPIGTLTEIAAGWSVATLLPVGWGNATVDFSVKILAPAIGPSLVAYGVALSAGKTLSVGEAKVFVVENGVETLCASGMATLRNFRAVTE